MAGRLSSGEREFATLVAQLRALEDDIRAARQAAHLPRGAGIELRARREPPPDLHGERVRLNDGAVIVVRPIEPGDARGLAIGLGRLGAVSRFRSFPESAERVTHEQLTELANVDHESREAIVAIDAVTGEGVGIARYARVPGEPTLANVGCVVLDAWQHRGVGTVLAERLAARARAAGIVRCEALVVLGDEAPRRLLAHFADDITEHRDGGTVDITARAPRMQA